MITLTVPPAAIQIVKQHEGLRLKAYQDSAGYWTIGYGHKNMTPPPCTECTQDITQDQAEAYLSNDLLHVITQIYPMLSVDLNDNQMSALVSFAFNLGLHSLETSTLLKKLNESDFQGAADEFLKWDHAGGVVVSGLEVRRQDERKLFLTPEDVEYVAGN